MIDCNNQYGTCDRQTELLEMMREVDQLLRTGGVKYSLCGGTLLGAVREKGFIPWDDDIDIMVNRYNFDKLIKLFRSDGDRNYDINDYLWVRRIQKKDETRPDLSAPTIDVFVMDNCPDNKLIQKIKVLLIKLLQGMMKVDKTHSQVSVFYRICLFVTGFLGKLFSERKKLRWYDWVSQIGNGKRTEQLGLYNDLFKNLNLKYSRKMFSRYIDGAFEDLVLPITAEYDNYLSTVYGDYMIPPSEEDRKPIHLI